MLRRRFSTALGLALLAALIASSLVPFQAAKQAIGQSSSSDPIEQLELRYDDGVAVGTMKGFGCEECHKFQGVWFTLPEGLPSAVLTSVKFYVTGGTDTVAQLWINVAVIERRSFGGDIVTQLITPMQYNATRGGWHTVAIPHTVVPRDFWIILARRSEANMPYYDGDLQEDPTRSWMGDTLDRLNQDTRGDLMIRAILAAEVHVGPGQTFATIQEAIDAVGAGTRIVVHESTYAENVSVYKSVYIKSYSGPTATIVQTPFADQPVFRITAPDVTISGFTIQGAGAACGVHIEEQTHCVISGNVIQDNNIGVCVSEHSSVNIILENQCSNNTTGVWIDGSENHISGNDLRGNSAPVGSAVYLSGTASGNRLRFNSFSVDEGADPAVASSPQVYNGNSSAEADAKENWWGSSSGPSEAGGQGVVAGTGVLCQPYLKVRPLRVKTVAASAGDFTVNAKNETSVTVLKEGDATPVVSVASFAQNPAGEFRGKAVNKWIDVLLSAPEGVELAEIRLHYTDEDVAALNEGALRMYWWNGEKWKSVSTSGVDKVNNIVWAQMTWKSKPLVSDLSGTYFAAGIGKSSGFAWWIIPLIIAILAVALIAFRLFWVLVVKQERY